MTQQQEPTKEHYTPSTSETLGEGDSDAIDYSTAIRRELGRSQTGDKLWRRNWEQSKSKVHVGFVEDRFITDDKSNNNDVVFDVLPSFQLHSTLLSTPTERMDPDAAEFPPDYSRSESEASIGTIPTEPMAIQSPSVDSLSTAPSNSTSNATGSVLYDPAYFNGDNSLDDALFDKNLIDNLHVLPRQLRGDLNVQIHITKDVPVPYQPSESESLLKEYTSGDVVHGYVTIRNNSKTPIPFDGFYVTLEGSISVIDTENKKQILKKFINMVDLSACWSFGCISPSGNITYKPLSKDHDGCTFGLRNDRILQPQTTYKKFFTFKFPYNTLDTICRHQQELHTLLPPSFGVNVLKKQGKYSDIEVQQTTNFGHNGKPGSPILTKDLSNRKLSINYSINSTLCALKPVGTSSQKKLYVISEDEYALRFIPFGFGVSLFSSKRAIEQLKRLVEQSFKTAERSLKLLQEGQEHEVCMLDNQIKMEQLRLSNRGNASDSSLTNFPLRNENSATPDISKIETALTYVQDSKNRLLSKFTSNNKSMANSSGFLSITTELPKDGLPYISPSLIRRTNEVSKLTSLGYENLEGMKNVLSQNEKKKLADLQINLKFLPSDNNKNSSNGGFPGISSVTAKLLVLNVYSSGSIPIKLSSDVCQPHIFKNLTVDFIKYHEKIEELTEQFKEIGTDIKKVISPDIIADIKAMKNLKNESFLLPTFNSTVSEETEWEKSEDGSYSRKLKIGLEFKDNITETLIPNFQTCIMSRYYFIQINFNFKNNTSAILRVPIRLRQFDGLS